ncbi:phosphoribosylformylglycinamidine synthase subunit PurS [Campylobacter sp. MIT 21-1685]|uniref:phosphoribosylformylglycinamidine synthase subunit PurS n=1 Tax=unclassified Campylobacter TaxID=2593542 RepID=UPI00224A6D8E|nr:MULTISPECIES: phosphoribosylformylglycinamidine synthase subunit PurS [unclassified Campylobacter]MCX2682570.1 phosphoribosylformylglycinamidine synthase subunit PurS [Campylobacter sp. MIT 21-1684]MCX2750717.1 phosphoribosylformylglycinamidine synthase subunit PurS [Campylobacter sp. MIT 21-1682]MCX2807051.1 phosphoribosylformylglycinamidine synthase subunit PurS [Campylobacter sp. MIT 21-1685]
MKVVINVFLKDGVLDPQGKSIEKALYSLNFNGIKEVRMGKQIRLKLDEKDKQKAQADVKKMCEELLVNKVIEEYEFFIKENE